MTPSLTVQAKRFQFVIAFSLLLFAVGQTDAESRRDHRQYDFHYDVRYPGQLRSDVSLDTVSEENAADLKSYNRRTVQWWPKRGMDIIPLEDIPGAPLRTWTPRVPSDSLTGTMVDNFPKQPFKAHLIGFRGVGDGFPKDVKDPTSYRCPAAVLRMADGRKRVFMGKYLSEPDRNYLMKVYRADRARMAKKLLPDEYILSDEARSHPEGESHLYKKEGHVRFDTKHFSVVVPSKAPLSGKSWVKPEDHEQVMATIGHLCSQVEAFWSYQEYGGGLMRYWKSTDRYKYVPTFGHGTGGGGGGYGGCTMGRVVVEGIWHEFGHGMACGGLMYPGGAETACDAMQMMGNAAFIHKAINQVRRPWKTAFFGQYPGAGAYDMMSDDPNWGYALAAVTSNLAAQQDKTPMHVYAHLGEERGLWKKGDGIRGVGDMFGQIGARRAEFDFQQEYQYRHHFATPNRSYLMAVDTEKGIYRCPPTEAPEPFGVSISRLVPDAGAKRVTVDFEGDFDPDTYSDWRACIVAVDKNDTCRYTPLWSKGKMSMDIKPGDKRFWLTVTATPKALLSDKNAGAPWVVYEAGYAYSYPYQVTLEGCTPGSPFNNMAENYNMTVAAPTLIHYRQTGILDLTGVQTPQGFPQERPYALDLPPRMTPEQSKAFAEQLKKNIAHTTAVKAKAEKTFYAKHKETDRVAGRGWKVPRPRINYTKSSLRRLQLLLDDLGGAPHPNGGGWVSAKSHADPTAYVGPNCYVLGGAKVLDHAQLIEGAVAIGDKAVVKDHAKLSGKGAAIGDVEVSGYARVIWPMINRPKPGSDAVDVGTLHVTGLPSRGRAEGLVANYDCVQAEAVLLEDLLKRRITTVCQYGYHTDFGQLSYNGHLVGSPGFDPAAGRGAYVFNGRDQYAELSPDVADMGEILVDLRVKLDAVGKPQTLFDFGGNVANRFMLTANPTGKLTLSWTVAGKTDAVTTSAALQSGVWSDLQVGIDGTQATIRVNGKIVARRKATFRPADVFPPTLGRRTLAMRSRDDAQPNYTKGQLDSLRIYSYVPADGESLPLIPPVSPVRVSAASVAKIAQAYGDHPYKEQAYRELTRDCSDMNRAFTWSDRQMLRKKIHEQEGNPKTVAKTLALRDDYYRQEAEVAIKRIGLHDEYMRSAGVLKKQAEKAAIEKEIQAATKKLDQARRKMGKETPKATNPAEEKAYQKKLAAYKARRTEAEKKHRAYSQKLDGMKKAVVEELTPQLEPIQKRVAVLKGEIAARKTQLRETEGPVAKAFAPVIAEAKAKCDRLKAIPKRTPEQETALRQAQRELDQLIGHRGGGIRGKVLVLKSSSWEVPSQGIFYRDLDLVKMQTEMDRLDRDAKAMVADRLIADTAYMAMAVLKSRQQSVLRDRGPRRPGSGSRRGPELPEQQELRKIEQRRSQLSRAIDKDREVYADRKLSPDIIAAEKAKNEFLTQCHENAKLHHAEEFRIAEKIEYKRIHFRQLAGNIAAQLASDIEPPDDWNQLQQAVELQKHWQTSTADWDTVHKYEKEYDQLNPVLQRWLRRVKPYRFSLPADSKNSEGIHNE
ncbi:MAG: hypothetical protein HN919_19605 [Verrucomicrobia bacterium]|nr:hypothetical protein [Verrucomicrobiota bacterium]